MAKHQDEIEAQYNKHPYPEPISNMDEFIKNGYAQASCLKVIWHRLFPEKKYCFIYSPFDHNLSLKIRGLIFLNLLEFSSIKFILHANKSILFFNSNSLI